MYIELLKMKMMLQFQPGLRALHVVARAGDLELTRALLRKRANVNFCTSVSADIMFLPIF